MTAAVALADNDEDAVEISRIATLAAISLVAIATVGHGGNANAAAAAGDSADPAVAETDAAVSTASLDDSITTGMTPRWSRQ